VNIAQKIDIKMKEEGKSKHSGTMRNKKGTDR
jgi:hypothetical protein